MKTTITAQRSQLLDVLGEAERKGEVEDAARPRAGGSVAGGEGGRGGGGEDRRGRARILQL